MKKVVFLIDSLPGGGAEKVLIDVIENLDKSKYDITVMTTIEGGLYVENIKKYVKYKSIFKDLPTSNNSIHRLYNKVIKKYRSLFLKYIPNKWLYKMFIDDNYDIEVAFLEGHATMILGSSTNKTAKKYAWVHIDLLANNWPTHFYKNFEHQRDTYRTFDAIYCVSDQVKEGFQNLIGLYDNVFTLYNPINEQKIKDLSNEPSSLEFDKGSFNIVTVGRLTHQKGYDRLLSVHKRLIKQGIKHHLYILGEGEDQETLEDFITENQLNSTVTLLGFHKNPYKYMKQADLFVCSSRSEGFSLVVAEALVLGIPVISTNCSGPSELLNYGDYGVITDNNEESLYENLKIILTDRQLYNHFKIKSQERGQYFKLETSINEIEKILG